MKQIVTLLLLIAAFAASQSNNSKQIVDLRGNWKFEIGDNKKYADPNFNDKKWDEIFVPSEWENEGYPGYDGYAWYRKTFILPASAQSKRLSLHMGYIDDACAVYVNGNLVGEGGRFEPDYKTAYNEEQKYFLPNDFLFYGKENTIVVRVYDEMQSGGIVRGKIGIFEQTSDISFVTEFPARWKFKAGDDDEWKKPNIDDSKWQELIVPAKWDFQGYRDYDGFAWYRVTFDAPSNYEDERLMLMLGKIDDLDETYLNGERIGKTGRMRKDGSITTDNDYVKIRAYNIPRSLLKAKQNVIAVRVYDGLKDGGIYEGPIGITTEKEYRKWDRNQNQNNENKFGRFLEKLFNE